MVNFNFTVDDIDAFNIIDIMRSGVNHCDVKIMDLMDEEGDKKAEIEWYKNQKVYVKNLIQIMSSSTTRVE